MGMVCVCSVCGYQMRLTPEGVRRCGWCAYKREQEELKNKAINQIAEEMVQGAKQEPKP